MTESDSIMAGVEAPGSSAHVTDFDLQLEKATTLFNSSNWDAALEQLLVLQEKYLDATRIFDMLGEIYLRQDDYKQGVRYKTLYEVLTGTLNAQKLSKPRTRPQPPEPEPEPGMVSPPETHYTATMGHQLCRQGHFDKAVEIFDRLLQNKPGDAALLAAREAAWRKHREKRLLSVLERWMQNIQDIKSGRAKQT